MHELSLMADLLRTIDRAARDHQAARVTGVRVSLGALTHMSPQHFQEHFERAALGTLAAGARLEIVQETDIRQPDAQSVLLVQIEVEDDQQATGERLSPSRRG